jgi:hypothetical protein
MGAAGRSRPSRRPNAGGDSAVRSKPARRLSNRISSGGALGRFGRFRQTLLEVADPVSFDRSSRGFRRPYKGSCHCCGVGCVHQCDNSRPVCRYRLSNLFLYSRFGAMFGELTDQAAGGGSYRDRGQQRWKRPSRPRSSS